MVALLLSLVITGFFYVRFNRQQAANRPKTQKVFAAVTDIQPGAPIAETSLKQIDWPMSVPLGGAISKKEDVVGRVLANPVTAGEPILLRDLASAGNVGLAAKIPDGYRAAAVKTNELNNLAGFVFPGSHVDVLVTLRGEGNSSFTRTVLQNVEVLSAGSKIEPDPNGKPENVSVVTLLVRPDESQKLALAQQQGSIQFVLRNKGDSQTVDARTVDMAELGGIPKKLAETDGMGHKHSVSRPAKNMYTVETIAGSKTTVAKFEATGR